MCDHLLERAAHSVYHFRLFVVLVISHFVFEGGALVLIASVPGHCLPFTCLIVLLCCCYMYGDIVQDLETMFHLR